MCTSPESRRRLVGRHFAALLGTALAAATADAQPAAANPAQPPTPAQTVDALLAASPAKPQLEAMAADLGAAIGGDIGQLLASGLQDDGTYRWRLLRGLDLGFLSFESAKGNQRGLGIAYDWSRNITRTRFAMLSANQSGSSFALKASGHAAFDRGINPRDFLDAGGSYALYASYGGVRAPKDAAALATALNDLESKMALITDPEALKRSPATRAYLDSVFSYLTTQTYVSVAADVHLESDQRFRERQWVYGGLVGLDVKAWNPRSSLAKLNVLDWPFAAIRWLSGTDAHFQVLGSSLPRVQLQLAQVDPVNDTTRTRLGAMTRYTRGKLEASFRTPVLEGAMGRVYFESNYRLYQELNAPTAVRQAGIDRFSYVSLAVVSHDGPYVSYSSGRLPFDHLKDRVYELGFKLDF